MPKDTDAYGHSVWDYFVKSKSAAHETIERSDGYIDPSDVDPALYFAPYNKWLDVERKAIKFDRGMILDVG